MKRSPIYRKDELVSARSLMLPFLITAVNGGLSLLALANISFIAISAQNSGEISYMNFLRVYYVAAVVELFLILLIAPAISASAVAAERERRTLSLLFTTRLRTKDIVIGKLMGAMSTLALLIVTALPVLATVFLYGGVTFREVILLLLVYGCSALYCAAVGITASTFFLTTAPAVAVSYVAIFVSYVLFFLLFYFRASIGGGLRLRVVVLGILGFMILASIVMVHVSEWGLRPHRVRRKKMPE